MKKTKYLLLFLSLSFQAIAAVPEWGKTGHRTVGEIATNHLHRKALRAVSDLLDGQGLAVVSTYADEIKSDKHYQEFYTWHYVNKPLDTDYRVAEKNPAGDLAKGIEHCLSVIRDKSASRKDRAFYLKMLVHLVGDLHQPLHVGRRADKGGNDVPVRWFYKRTNLHAVWDSKMIGQYEMAYTELAANSHKLSKKEIKQLQQGTVTDWVNETGQLASVVYASAAAEENLSYRYMYDHFDLLRNQLQKGGIRLAKLLNDLFA
ncbi:MAG: S1/P1 nuclease [Lutibacter sp.]|jgi:hypothetical protein|nr:S1/P1 nuclease [Lutibacter sp.]